MEKYKNYTKSDLEQEVGGEVANDIYAELESLVEDSSNIDSKYENILRIICEQIIK